eukprot:CAMPEP_0185804082 /NCGR_PEP_ID=MMETSP1322-20130828/3051_1 /TAXON_ID=265543 /ORGANISM="Minutocellus polymorphus, Strain RCC2270" /LENGTH=44 /DNA_ID= /DNA_START= /DNA_END= /DNA_ORIENTATION=
MANATLEKHDWRAAVGRRRKMLEEVTNAQLGTNRFASHGDEFVV